MQSFLSEIHVVPNPVRAGSVTLSRVSKINLFHFPTMDGWQRFLLEG